jgi:hypothetical protein
LQYADGKTEDGSPIAICFFSTDPLTRALCTVEGFEEPTVFEENDPELIKPEIQRSLARVLELLAMTRSVAQRRKAQLSYAALEWLQGEYDMIMMLHAREAAAEQRVEGDEAEAEGEEPEEEPEEEEEVAEE